jgi:hypothetical protein
MKHGLTDPAELLFFRGYTGENAHYGFNVLEANSQCYCSQERLVNPPDASIFEILWEPDKTEFTEGTSAESRANIKFENPEGFSGSLVWNTRYLERTMAGEAWQPEDAIVTGLLRRFDPETKTLLALRAEHPRDWINAHLAA